MSSRIKFFLVVVACSVLGSSGASANVLIANTVLGSSTTTQDSACGWLTMPTSSISPTATTTVDVIFSLSANASASVDQGIIGGTAGALNAFLLGGALFKRIDIDYGSGTVPFYLQSQAAFIRGTSYHLAIQSSGGITRAWVNGVAMTTNATSNASNYLYASQAHGAAQAFSQIGGYYGHGGGFQGSVQYARIVSTNVYSMTDTVTMTNTLTNVANTQFLMTPTTYIPTYAVITAATYSNPNVTFTANNNFVPGDTITIKSALVSGYNKSNAQVVSASGSAFTVNYGASNPGTWSGLGDAVTTAVTKDDIGNTAIQWVDAVCTAAASGPGIIVAVAATPSILTGGTGSIYRKATTLRVTMPADGRITFYAQGKPIPGCKNFAASAGIASCIWKPSLHGTVTISAVMTLTSAPLINVSPGYLQVAIDPRSDNR